MPKKNRFDDEPPPGMLPDGTLNVVDPDDPPFEPEIVDEDDEDVGDEDEEESEDD